MTVSIPDEVVRDLASRYVTDPGRLELLGGGAASSDGVRYAIPGAPALILKVQVRPTADLTGRLAAAERLANIDGLIGHGVPMPELHRSDRGCLLETADLGQTSFSAYAMRHRGGQRLQQLPRSARTRYLADLGRALARFHVASRRLPTWRGSATQLDGRPVLSWKLEWEYFASICRDAQVLEVWRELRTELERAPATPEGFGFVHNDPHLGNVLADGDQLTLIDLDVATYRWFASDVAIAVWSIIREGRDGDDLARLQVRTLVEAYREHHPLEPVWLEALPVHVAYRRALLLMALHDELPARLRDRWRQAVLRREIHLPWPTSGASRTG